MRQTNGKWSATTPHCLARFLRGRCLWIKVPIGTKARIGAHKGQDSREESADRHGNHKMSPLRQSEPAECQPRPRLWPHNDRDKLEKRGIAIVEQFATRACHRDVSLSRHPGNHESKGTTRRQRPADATLQSHGLRTSSPFHARAQNENPNAVTNLPTTSMILMQRYSDLVNYRNKTRRKAVDPCRCRPSVNPAQRMVRGNSPIRNEGMSLPFLEEGDLVEP